MWWSILGLNWTKVGLKENRADGRWIIRVRLNWTKVGLKGQGKDQSLVVAQSLNWTKVGLKARSISSRRFNITWFELD